jgi:hypothetical protein
VIARTNSRRVAMLTFLILVPQAIARGAFQARSYESVDSGRCPDRMLWITNLGGNNGRP